MVIKREERYVTWKDCARNYKDFFGNVDQTILEKIEFEDCKKANAFH